MTGILNEDFNWLGVMENEIDNGIESVDEDDLVRFYKGEKVEILKTINHDSFLSNTAYVIYSPNSGESMTIDSSFVDIIK